MFFVLRSIMCVEGKRPDGAVTIVGILVDCHSKIRDCRSVGVAGKADIKCGVMERLRLQRLDLFGLLRVVRATNYG